MKRKALVGAAVAVVGAVGLFGLGVVIGSVSWW